MRPRRMARQLWRSAALASIGLAGGAALVTARHLLTTPQPLTSGLSGEGRVDRRHGGHIYYTVAGPEDGRPVVLLHGFYVGASSYEFRAVFTRLAHTYRVYAPDWLGFGMSERPPLTHTGEFYATMLGGFLRDVVGAPAAVIAHGLAANIAVRAASDAPQLFDRLTLVAPEADAGMRLDPTLGQTTARLMQKVALGLTPYAILSLRPMLRLAAGRRSAVGPMNVDDATLANLSASAHQLGGEHATLSLLTGELDLPIRQVFPLLQTPTLIIVGARDTRHSLTEMERLVTLNPHADLEVVSNAGETVYLDQPTLFVHALHRWLGRRLTAPERPARPATPAPEPIRAVPATSTTSSVSGVSSVAAPEATLGAIPSTPPALSNATPPAAPTPLADVAEPQTRDVKIIPVVEPLSMRRDSSSDEPLEAHVVTAQEDDVTRGPTEPTDAVQTLWLEPMTDVSVPEARGPSSPPGHRDNASGRQAFGIRPGQVSTVRGGAYLYVPEIGAHLLRSDSGSGGAHGVGRSSPRPSRRGGPMR
ncbi:MAG TPA: alpha/beta hydrolase [Ktedonobacterales bacterium]|nr:alpha/beta hydrolase [Ktedonobacterales bacterium]